MVHIQDLLPEGSEQLRWDDDELFMPAATPPERALNALLEILLDSTGDDPPGTTGDGDQGQGSPFDADNAEVGGWPGDGEARSGSEPDESPPRRGRKRLRPVVIAHLQLNDLQHLASSTAQTAHGVDLPPAALRQLLCQADLIPAVFNSDGVLLDFGSHTASFPVQLGGLQKASLIVASKILNVLECVFSGRNTCSILRNQQLDSSVMTCSEFVSQMK